MCFCCTHAARSRLSVGLLTQSEQVSVAAYAALRPDLPLPRPHPQPLTQPQPQPAGRLMLLNLSGRAATTLRLLTLRAQRPLHLTAGRYTNVTLELFLDVSDT